MIEIQIPLCWLYDYDYDYSFFIIIKVNDKGNWCSEIHPWWIDLIFQSTPSFPFFVLRHVLRNDGDRMQPHLLLQKERWITRDLIPDTSKTKKKTKLNKKKDPNMTTEFQKPPHSNFLGNHYDPKLNASFHNTWESVGWYRQITLFPIPVWLRQRLYTRQNVSNNRLHPRIRNGL